MLYKIQFLNRLNVINDCFFIWHSGPLATVNSFRAGRLLSKQVNSLARTCTSYHSRSIGTKQMLHSGRLCCCFAVLECRMIGTMVFCVFLTPNNSIALFPLGSFSRISKGCFLNTAMVTFCTVVDDAECYCQLYSDDSFPLMPKRSFNSALIALLQHIRVSAYS